jgi:hypothetical protein
MTLDCTTSDELNARRCTPSSPVSPTVRWESTAWLVRSSTMPFCPPVTVNPVSRQ